ncbi:hypothetical protein DFH08DRAFT_798906 [Mycena albidolilacea]|uniref:Uncharacterized protein n=1 Tax=Mycena albidolilacea TaxID=1033008 RepID=A0AAD7APR1_9AGAR|nr:hypothetical protein DFH08DRAFT_798906 [Mycena albidolilacea]
MTQKVHYFCGKAGTVPNSTPSHPTQNVTTQKCLKLRWVRLPLKGEFTFWLAKVACIRAKWLVLGGGVDLGVITRPRPAEWLASHFVGLASHSAGLASAKIEKWLAHSAH